MRENPPDWDETWKRHGNVVGRIGMWVLAAATLLWLGYKFGLEQR